MSVAVAAVTKNTFEAEVLHSNVPVFVDFWASWCGPCRMFAPILDQIAEENPDTLKVVKVNVDEEPELDQQLGVMSIPTLVLIRDGKVVSTSVGVRPKDAVLAMLG